MALPMDPTAAVPQPSLDLDLDATTEVLLIRHGRSADVVPGTPESADPGLHPLGRQQAGALADRLAGKTIHAIYASHLARAIETARALAEPRGLPIGVHEDLQEVLMGDWSHGEFRRRAAVRDPQWVAWAATGRWDGIPGGEGDAALRERVSTVVRELAARHVGETIAVVAHGGAINACVADIFGIERTMWMSCENTSITTLQVTAERTMILGANDCSHLYDPVLGAPS